MSQPANPTRLNRNAVFASGAASLMSADIAMIAPAPAQTPLTAAMMGCGQARMAFTRSPVIRVNWSKPVMSIFTSGPMISCTSPPEEKLPPAPLTTMALTESAWTSARNMSRSSA